jgi:hypothetical protein
MNISISMNEVDEIFGKGGIFSYENLKFVSKKMRKGMSQGSYGAHYGSKGYIFFYEFWVAHRSSRLGGYDG